MEDAKLKNLTWRISEEKIAKRKNKRVIVKYVIIIFVFYNALEGIYNLIIYIILILGLLEYFKNRSSYGNRSMVELNRIDENGISIQNIKTKGERLYPWNKLSDYYVVKNNFIGFISSILGIDIVLRQKENVIWLYFENERDKQAVANELSKYLLQKK